jgi:hypothetical protein
VGVNLPLSIIHGVDDTTILIKFTRKLFADYGGKKRYIAEIPEASHNNIVAWILESDLDRDFRAFVRTI